MRDLPPNSPAERPSRSARRARRVWRVRLKRVLTGVALGLALLVGALTILTRTPVCKWWLLPAISGAMGLDVSARRAMVLSSGTVVLEGAVFSIPGIDGPAGRLIEVDRLEVDPDLGRPGVPIARMRVDGAVVRVSQATDADRVNVQFWNLPGGGGGGGGPGPRPAPPRIDLRSATIQLGEHGPGTGPDGYRILKQMVVRGSVVPATPRDGSWVVNLHEVDPADPERALRDGIAVEGRIDDRGVHLEMTQADLSDFPASAVPSRHRQLFEMLAIEGEITRTFLELPWEGRVEAGIHLRDVSVTLPFEPRPETMRLSQERGVELALPQAGGGFRLTRSGGTVSFLGSGLRAELEGWVEDLPYSVDLEYMGLAGESAFRCVMSTTDFHLSESPRLVPFLPRDVFERLNDFRNPTGLVDAEVVVQRGEPSGGRAAPTTFSGTLSVREGRASFKDFPYLFEGMEARVTFDEQEVRIERISGVSASGARLSASGLVSPLGDDARVEIRVTVTGAPIDDRMLEALGPDQAQIIDAIFSRERMAELEAAGLVIGPGRRDELLAERDALTRRLAELSTVAGVEAREEARRVRASAAACERLLRAPVFGLGGLADVTVVVSRTPEPETWTNTVEISLARAGVLPVHFPYPIEATGVLFSVVDHRLTLDRGEFRPLGGGTVTARVEAMLPDGGSGDGAPEEGESEHSFAPKVELWARGVPVDRLVLHAVGHAGDPKDEGTGEGDWLAPMHSADLDGTIDADVVVLAREDGQIGFDATATIPALRAAPPEKPEMPGTIVVQAREMSLNATERGVRFGFEADVVTREAAGGVSIGSGAYHVDGEVDLAGDALGRKAWAVRAAGQDVLAQAPIERVIGLVSPEGEAALAQMRATYAPTGSVRGMAQVSGFLGEPEPAVWVELAEADGLEVTLGEGRVGVSGGEGTVRVQLPAAGRAGELVATGFRASTTHGGREQGRIGLDGRVELLAAGPGGQGGGSIVFGGLDVRLTVVGGALESWLTRGALAAMAPERAAEVEALDPAGVFDLDLAVRRESVGSDTAFEGSWRPRSLAVTLEGERVAFHDVRGVVRFDARGGQAEGVSASGPAWSIGGDAVWTRSSDGQVVVDASGVWADAASLSPAVRAMLPGVVREAIEPLKVEVSGPISLSEGVVHASLTPVGESSITTSGAVRVTGASATVGVPIEGADGTLWFESESGPGQTGRWRLSLAGDRLRAGGLLLEGARATVASGQREGEVLVPSISAGLYGGRLAGDGRMVRGAGEALRYDMRVQMSGVRFATLLADRAAEAERVAARTGRARRGVAGVDVNAEAADASRGILAAEVSLGGVVGQDSSRRGRGSIQIGGGPVVSLPLLMPVIEVTNLRLPASTPLDVAFAEFFVLGDTVTFEEVSAFTRSVEIWGYGTLSWVEQRLDMRVSTRSTSPIPVVSEVLEGVRNELVSTRVAGTLAEPEVETVQFSGTRRVLDTLLGDGPDEQQRRLSEIGERARLNRTRALRAGERLRWLVASEMEAQESRPSQGP